MKFHNITTNDMLNGDGLRTVLWLSGCSHRCKNCQNPITWDPSVGVDFTEESYKEISDSLSNSWISGITLSGGDPLYKDNLNDVLLLCKRIKKEFPTKTIWLYSGFVLEDLFNSDEDDMILRKEILSYVDIFVDGKFVNELKDTSLHWVGSSNQRIIDMQRTLSLNKIILKS